MRRSAAKPGRNSRRRPARVLRSRATRCAPRSARRARGRAPAAARRRWRSPCARRLPAARAGDRSRWPTSARGRTGRVENLVTPKVALLAAAHPHDLLPAALSLFPRRALRARRHARRPCKWAQVAGRRRCSCPRSGASAARAFGAAGRARWPRRSPPSIPSSSGSPSTSGRRPCSWCCSGGRFERLLAADARAARAAAAARGPALGPRHPHPRDGPLLPAAGRAVAGLAAPRRAGAGRARRVPRSRAVLVVAPWTYRNWLVFHAFVPVSTAGGLNLFQGNARLTRQEVYDRYEAVHGRIEQYRFARRDGHRRRSGSASPRGSSRSCATRCRASGRRTAWPSSTSSAAPTARSPRRRRVAAAVVVLLPYLARARAASWRASRACRSDAAARCCSLGFLVYYNLHPRRRPTASPATGCPSCRWCSCSPRRLALAWRARRAGRALSPAARAAGRGRSAVAAGRSMPGPELPHEPAASRLRLRGPGGARRRRSTPTP